MEPSIESTSASNTDAAMLGIATFDVGTIRGAAEALVDATVLV
eukprot:CAMPEP_0194409078 /NCGR_PEP_ID=MMETSP0176-20130528/6879_1 /TAXON_ID=216777 /ORGANISM="Proboscia alata, Strain PI-D3" /LENGTH=42 /DNA_ID= /DNA_START= /DNA_END= /DNA_ORIENTATION=